MPALRNDWSWRPPFGTVTAIKRGDAKVKQYALALRESMFNFNRAARKQMSQRELARRYNEQREIRYYLARVEGSKRGNQRSVWADVKPTQHPVSKRRRPDYSVRRDVWTVDVVWWGALAPFCQYRTTDPDVGLTRAGKLETTYGSKLVKQLSKASGWQTLVLLDGKNTRAFARYEDSELALLAADFEPECRKAKDWVILGASSIMVQLGPNERAALIKQAGLGTELSGRAAEEDAIKRFLAKFEPTRDRLSEAAENYRINRSDDAADHRRTQENDDMAKAKKKGKAKKGAEPAKGERKERTGTVAAFIREQIDAGKENKAIAEAAAKKFDKPNINSGYVAWYRNKMSK